MYYILFIPQVNMKEQRPPSRHCEVRGGRIRGVLNLGCIRSTWGDFIFLCKRGQSPEIFFPCFFLICPGGRLDKVAFQGSQMMLMSLE